jgi:two-component system NtrC family sensor kinase
MNPADSAVPIAPSEDVDPAESTGPPAAGVPVHGRISHSERLASLGILAAGVGHEINNPLASMTACVQSLERWLDSGPRDDSGFAEARELCGMLEREVERCREITDKLMQLAQPYSSEPTEQDFRRAVADTLSLLRFQMRTQGIVLEEEIEPDLPKLWARSSGVRSLCMNLILNAVQAMPNGGRLRVSAARRGGVIEFIVQDSGPGIPTELLERIWDPFFTTKPPGQGTGLGLAVTARAVRGLRGTIVAANHASGGAIFTVRMPFPSAEEKQP